MNIYKGKSVSEGIAIGKAYIFKKQHIQIENINITNVRQELKRLKKAKEKAISDLDYLYKKAVQETGKESAAIFDAHKMIVEDVSYNEKIVEMIKNQKVSSEYAVKMVTDKYVRAFFDMQEDFIREKTLDIKDVAFRLLTNLKGSEFDKIYFPENAIVFAEELTPSETMRFEKSNILAFITRKGSENSHSSILAKTMGIPALVGVNYSNSVDGQEIIVDACQGDLYVSPTNEVYEKMLKKKEEYLLKKEMLLHYRGKENITTKGKKIEVYANIGEIEDIDSVLYNDASGIGLFRSEFLYLQKNNFPTLQEQFEAYKEVALRMGKRNVVIRTADLGTDKNIEYYDFEEEPNPAMGYRAIRFSLDNISIFKTQIKAILMASIYGNLSVMYPMINSIEEIKRIKDIVDDVKFELKSENIIYKDIKQGVMIETPAAALMSEEFAKQADFFSIGTNDLSQYILAIDRQNQKLDKYFNPHHPAILKTIEMIVKNAHKAGIKVAICGELAGDKYYTEKFIEIGVDELSVPPSCVLELRKVIRSL